MPPVPFCERLLDAQAAFGPHARDVRASGELAFGRCLYRSLVEDLFDRQPLAAGDGLLLVADVRIDNRDELLAALDLGPGSQLADSDILLRGWQRWREGLLDRLLGDFALAVWEPAAERLTLARDPLGERPLHYGVADGVVAFASIAPALAALHFIDGAVDDAALVDFVADHPRRGSRSFYRGVHRVEPGHVVVVGRDGIRSRRWWDPRGPEISLPGPEAYGEALRAELDAAVARRLRRASGAVGSHLSGGLDSGAVTSSAALLLGGEPLHAFTSAPRAGFDGPAPPGYVPDESEAAAAVGALYPNIDHHVIRPGPGLSPLPLLDRDHRLTGQPVGHVVGNLWWSEIAAAAKAQGVTVMLTGEAGNFTLTAGLGLDDLADLLRRGRPTRWLREARALARREGCGWRSILNASLGPAIPTPAYRALRGLFGAADTSAALTFVAPGRETEVEGWETRPSADPRERRWRMLQLIDPGNFRKRSLALWGIEERDPTADARFVRFCFSLPPEARLAGGIRRPALRAALAGRIPQPALDRPIRGFQGADWHERVDGASIRAAFQPLAQAAREIVDPAAMEQACASWPTTDLADRMTIYTYSGQCLRALSAAHFAAMHTSS